MEPIVIKYNTTKQVLYTILSLVFVAAGYFMFGRETTRYPKEIVYIASIICSVFGLITGFIFIKRLLSKDKTALVIDSKGITDKTATGSPGFIPWQDVAGIQLTEFRQSNFSKTYLITVLVNNPEEYIAKGKHAAARYSLQWSTDKYGSPINISPHSVGLKHLELEKIIREAFEHYKSI